MHLAGERESKEKLYNIPQKFLKVRFSKGPPLRLVSFLSSLKLEGTRIFFRLHMHFYEGENLKKREKTKKNVK
jgi:hypothetical protein